MVLLAGDAQLPPVDVLPVRLRLDPRRPRDRHLLAARLQPGVQGQSASPHGSLCPASDSGSVRNRISRKLDCTTYQTPLNVARNQAAALRNELSPIRPEARPLLSPHPIVCRSLRHRLVFHHPHEWR